MHTVAYARLDASSAAASKSNCQLASGYNSGIVGNYLPSFVGADRNHGVVLGVVVKMDHIYLSSLYELFQCQYDPGMHAFVQLSIEPTSPSRALPHELSHMTSLDLGWCPPFSSSRLYCVFRSVVRTHYCRICQTLFPSTSPLS